jgi:hypothetical protein
MEFVRERTIGQTSQQFLYRDLPIVTLDGGKNQMTARTENNKALRDLSALCVSAVKVLPRLFTAETQSSLR